MSVSGAASLYFVQPGTTINGGIYLDLLKNKLYIHMVVHDCNVFVNDGTPCNNRSKQIKNYW